MTNHCSFPYLESKRADRKCIVERLFAEILPAHPTLEPALKITRELIPWRAEQCKKRFGIVAGPGKRFLAGAYFGLIGRRAKKIEATPPKRARLQMDIGLVSQSVYPKIAVFNLFLTQLILGLKQRPDDQLDPWCLGRDQQ